MPYCTDIKMWPPALYLSPCSHLAVNQRGVCSRFRAMWASSNIAALPTSVASQGGCKGSHMPSPKLLPKYIFNKAAARFFGFFFFPVQLCLMNKTEKPRPNSLLICRVQESEDTSCLCYSLQALGSRSAAGPHPEAPRAPDDHCRCLSKLRCISAALQCILHLQPQPGQRWSLASKMMPTITSFQPNQSPCKQALG